MDDQIRQTEEINKRLLQAVSYLIEWSKHIVTGSGALMVLTATLLKDLTRGASPPLSYVLAASVVLFYVSMTVAVWLAVGLVRQCARTVLTTAVMLGTGDDLNQLQRRLDKAQCAFLTGIVLFALASLLVLLNWAAPLRL